MEKNAETNGIRNKIMRLLLDRLARAKKPVHALSTTKTFSFLLRAQKLNNYLQKRIFNFKNEYVTRLISQRWFLAQLIIKLSQTVAGASRKAKCTRKRINKICLHNEHTGAIWNACSRCWIHPSINERRYLRFVIETQSET